MKNSVFVIAASLAACVFSGCVMPEPEQRVPRLATFIESEYAPYAKKGTGRIIGSAFLKTRGGDVKLGAGCMVSLNPVTSYSREFFSRTVGQGVALESPDPRVLPFNRLVVADATGSFEFTDLPAGEYYLSCAIIWEVAGSTTGGYAGARVWLGEGETVKAVVTR